MRLLRYPGGSAHGYDLATVGPLSQRGEWHFGLDEYLAVCRQSGAAPLITMSDYTGTPQDCRAFSRVFECAGHARPSLGAETRRMGASRALRRSLVRVGQRIRHGNRALLPHKQYTPDTYANYALATGRAMKAVDPAIQLGIVTAAGKPVDDP